jgi:RNA-binding, Nab2-type zinc finger
MLLSVLVILLTSIRTNTDPRERTTMRESAASGVVRAVLATAKRFTTEVLSSAHAAPNEDLADVTFFSCYGSYKKNPDMFAKNIKYADCQTCGTEKFARCGSHAGLCFHGYGPRKCVYHMYYTYLAHIEKNIRGQPEKCTKPSCPMNGSRQDIYTHFYTVHFLTGLRSLYLVPICLRDHKNKRKYEVSTAEQDELKSLHDVIVGTIPDHMLEVLQPDEIKDEPKPREICKFGSQCKFGKSCRYQHVDGEPVVEATEKSTVVLCKNGENCKFKNCRYSHPERDVTQSLKSQSNHETEYLRGYVDAMREMNVFRDPVSEARVKPVPKARAKPVPEARAKPVPEARAKPVQTSRLCRYGESCRSKNCTFVHPAPKVPTQNGGKK